MAGLCSHLAGRHPGFDGAGGEACAKAVTAEAFGDDPGIGEAIAQDGGHGVGAQAVCASTSSTCCMGQAFRSCRQIMKVTPVSPKIPVAPQEEDGAEAVAPKSASVS